MRLKPRIRRLGVCGHILQTGHMLNIRCDFCHVLRMSALACCPRVGDTCQGSYQQLVIRVDGKGTSLQDETEIADPLNTCQQLPVKRTPLCLSLQFAWEKTQRLPCWWRAAPMLDEDASTCKARCAAGLGCFKKLKLSKVNSFSLEVTF
jgi:hypothetical protein